MATQRRIIVAVLAIVAIMMMTTVLALLQTMKTIPSTGTISPYKVYVYSDAGLSIPLDSMTWTVNPGYSTTQTIYILNNATSLDMNLNMTLASWLSTNTSNCLTLTWDRENYRLNHTLSIDATLNLTAFDTSETQIGLTFSLDTKIIGNEVP